VWLLRSNVLTIEKYMASTRLGGPSRRLRPRHCKVRKSSVVLFLLLSCNGLVHKIAILDCDAKEGR
jgi:hypothetical protein